MSEDPRDDRDAEQSRPKALSWVQSLQGNAGALLAWSAANRLRAALVAGACVASVAGVVVGWVAIAAGGPAGPPVTLEMALEKLDLGAYDDAREMANRLKEQADLPMDELGGPAFVLGAAAARQAEQTWSKDKTRYYLLAARYLEEARDRGFPSPRQAEGLYLLGRSLYLSGQIPASRPVLLEALKLNKRRKTEIHGLLAEAYLRDANPMLERALAENTLYLSDGRLARDERHRGLVQRARILLRLDRADQCNAALEKVPDDAKNQADAIVIRGRMLMREGQLIKGNPDATAEEQLEARRKYQAARETFLRAQGRDTLSTQATGKAMYLTGICYVELGEYGAALAQFARTSKLYEELPEGLAASFQEAELSRQLGRDKEAMAGYRRVLDTITRPENFSNPWLTLEALRNRVLDTYQHYLKIESFDIALQLTKHLHPLLPRERTVELTAEVHRSWGDALLQRATHLPPEKVAATGQQARAQLRRAGRIYWRLAEMQVATRRYSDHLWNSAGAYLRGQDYIGAVGALRRYLKAETRRRHPQALVNLGEAMLALNQIDRALEALEECYEFHGRDPVSYRARLLAAKAHLEEGNSQQAESLLRENLSGEYLTPDSREWRDSLFALGQLLRAERRYPEAIQKLEEAVERYPDDPQALPARYAIADTYHQAALDARRKLEQDLPGAVRAAHSRQIREYFDAALQKHDQLRVILNRRQETGELAPREKLMLRNCYFAIAEVHFHLGEYDTAIKAYSTATNRYQSQPAVMLAYVQMANAYRRLDKPVEARATIEQAKAVLGRMKDESLFAETTNYNRRQWEELLKSLGEL